MGGLIFLLISKDILSPGIAGGLFDLKAQLNGLEAVAFKPLFFYVDYLITDLIPIPF